jgi:two-component system response regulator ResD
MTVMGRIKRYIIVLMECQMNKIRGNLYMDTNARVLVVDDEDRIRRLVKMYLEREDYEIDEANNGADALEMALKEDYDCIILDLMMPEMDGIEVCQELRKQKSTPVIMLTAKGEESNRVQGFEVGADDYIVKPFSPREVVLRVKALLRRVGSSTFTNGDRSTRDILVFPHLTIDHDAHRVTAGDVEVNLTPKEYELLCFLAKSPDKVFNREVLLKKFGNMNSLETYVQ